MNTFLIDFPTDITLSQTILMFDDILIFFQVIIPPDGYLQAVRDLCSKHNILMIADEIQSGLARSGRVLACDWENVRPDVIVRTSSLFGLKVFMQTPN